MLCLKELVLESPQFVKGSKTDCTSTARRQQQERKRRERLVNKIVVICGFVKIDIWIDMDFFKTTTRKEMLRESGQ